VQTIYYVSSASPRQCIIFPYNPVVTMTLHLNIHFLPIQKLSIKNDSTILVYIHFYTSGLLYHEVDLFIVYLTKVIMSIVMFEC